MVNAIRQGQGIVAPFGPGHLMLFEAEDGFGLFDLDMFDNYADTPS